MLEHRKQDAVARPQVRGTPALRDEIDRLGRAPGEHQFVLGAADERRDPPPSRFIGQRHLGRARINPAMDGRIIAAERPRDRIDHDLRLLRGRAGVEVVPWLAFGGEQARKLRTDMLAEPVGRSLRSYRSVGEALLVIHTNVSSRASASACSRSSSGAPANASATNACSISRFASAGGSPREAR